MDIHKPKPWHGLREFLKEYGIIVLGVLTALAGEQAVDDMHRRSELREAREALRVEIEYDLWGVKNQLSLAPCVARRLDSLGLWIHGSASAHPLKLSRPISGPIYLLPNTSVWRVATASVVAKMPFQERVQYAQLYDELASFDGVSQRNVELWREASKNGNVRTLDAKQADLVLNDVQSLRAAASLLSTDGNIVLDQGNRLHLLPKSDAPYIGQLHEKQAEFCKAIIANPERTDS